MHQFWTQFTILLATPFEHIALIWGIVPLYFSWIFNELTSSKANFRTAIQTGFSFLWAGAQWLYALYAAKPESHGIPVNLGAVPVVNLAVTALVLALGAVALVSGICQRFPKYGRFLGHTRFANYFMITIYPMQAHWLAWTWVRLETVLLFAIPVWLLFYLALLPLRK